MRLVVSRRSAVVRLAVIIDREVAVVLTVVTPVSNSKIVRSIINRLEG